MREGNLLILSLDYPPNDGGISRLAAGAVRALEASGTPCRVVTFTAGDRPGILRPPSKIVEVARRKGLRDWQLFREIRRHLRRFGAEAPILTTVWNPEATLAMLAGGKRVTILAHGNEVMPYSKAGPKELLRRFVLERARVIICNSRFTQTLVQRIAPAARTAVLNPAIDADRFQPSTSKHEARQCLGLPLSARIVLTVARLDPIKGHETVLRAMAALPKHQRSGLFYVIIGKGEMQKRLESLARELLLESQVRFAGFVEDALLPLWYSAADIFVLPSIFDPERRGMEGFGMALTEAQAAGLPVIGARSGGIPDAVREGEGGWLINERDTVALADHLRRLLSEPEAFATQGRLGFERIRREMNWKDYADSLRELM